MLRSLARAAPLMLLLGCGAADDSTMTTKDDRATTREALDQKQGLPPSLMVAPPPIETTQAPNPNVPVDTQTVNVERVYPWHAMMSRAYEVEWPAVCADPAQGSAPLCRGM